MNWFCLLVFSFFLNENVQASACCGGSFASPATITGDDKAHFSSSISYSEIKSDVGANGLWRRRSENESSQTLRLEGAHILSDRWQAGIGVPIIQRQRADDRSAGLGDIATQIGYEYLPELEYSAWKPKGIGYLQLTAPTGRSIYESQDSFGLDSRGRGFWALGMGTILTKALARWDLFLRGELHRAREKNVNNTQVQGTLKPGWGGNLTIGAGYNTQRLRFGTNLGWNYEDPVDLLGPTNLEGQAQRFATLTLMASYLADEKWSATLSYADQTLFGSPSNTSLAQTVLLQVQRRWER